MKATTASVADLRHSIAELHEATQSFDLHEYEPASGPDTSGLLDATRGLLARALALLDLVLERYDQRAAAHEGPSPGARGERSRAVADVAAVARMVLHGRLAALRAPPESRWGTVAVASGALRATRRSLGAVDLAIATCEGLEESTGFARFELARSLLVRREYARFRRDLLALPAPSTETVQARLRSAGNLIARLIGTNAYPQMRIKDRILVRDLQDRLRTHLLSALRERAAPTVEGLRLWQDVEILARLFDGVNRREELVQHDERCASEGLAALSSAEGAVPDELRARLAPLVGRDDQLDRLLRSPGCASDEVRARLLAVVTQLAESATRRHALPPTASLPPPPHDNDYL